MEKAMQQAHGVGYAEYDRNFLKRIEIEKKRENDYKMSKELTRQFS